MMAATKLNPTCAHCQKPAQSLPVWCCSDAELSALRAVMDDIVRNLDSEVVAPVTLGDVGDSTAYAMLRHTREQIRKVRGQ